MQIKNQKPQWIAALVFSLTQLACIGNLRAPREHATHEFTQEGILSELAALGCSTPSCALPRIAVTRTSGVVPFAVQFRQTGPLHHHLRWEIQGVSTTGFLAASVFDQPGVYTAKLFRTIEGVTELADTIEVTALPFTGETFYVDCHNGNDSNTGFSPEQAWRSPLKIQTHLSERFPVETQMSPSRYNLRYLLKRGTVCELPKSQASAQWLHLGGTHLLRLGAYGDPSLPRPIILESRHRSRADAWSNMIYHHWNVQDVVYSDLEIVGNYDERFPDGETRYPTVGINPHDSREITLFRMRLRHLWGGLWVQGGSSRITVHQSVMDTIGNVHLYGESEESSFTDSVLTRSSSGHNVYYGGKNLLFARNTILDSGFSMPQGWMQCGLRIESKRSSDPYSENVLIQDNTIGGSTGFSVCLTRNDYNSGLGPQNVIIERNRLQGHSPRIVELQNTNIPGLDLSYGGALITWGAGSVTVRNNLILNPRGPAIQLNATAASGSHWIRVLNNTIFKRDQPLERVFDLDGSSRSYGYRIRNNLVFGPILTAYQSSERPISQIPETWITNNLFYDPSSPLHAGRIFGKIKRGINEESFTLGSWLATNTETQSLFQVDPLFAGAGVSPTLYLRLQPGSPAARAGVYLGSAPSSFLGNLRTAPATSIGAFESGE